MYELFVKGVKTPLIVQLQAVPIGTVLTIDSKQTEFPFGRTLESDPEKGSYKFFVLCDKFATYTCIGADNRHHAANKATKLFGPHWSQVRMDHNGGRGYQYIPVPDFKELLKTLPN